MLLRLICAKNCQKSDFLVGWRMETKRKNQEIEIQVRIENSQPLKEWLENGARFLSEKRQIDEYFVPAHRDFLAVRPIQEWLRLREEKGIYSITYKKWYTSDDGRSWHCDEYETKIEDIKQMKELFRVINIKSIVTVDKTRKNYIFQNYKISFDNVKNLGDFVEIEYIGEQEVDEKDTAYEMIDFLKRLGCGKIERNNGGYPFMLLFPEETKFEEL